MKLESGPSRLFPVVEGIYSVATPEPHRFGRKHPICTSAVIVHSPRGFGLASGGT